MKNLRYKYVIVLPLVILFVLPGWLAYLFYKHPGLLSASTTNKGILVNPPIQLTLTEVTKAGKLITKGISFDKGPKWKLLVWEPGDCKKDCLNQIDRVSRIRLALGRKLYRVEVGIFSKDPLQTVEEATQKQLSNFDVHYFACQDSSQFLGSKPGVFLIDPNNFLVLAYTPKDKSENIFRDLKRLLNNAEQTA